MAADEEYESDEFYDDYDDDVYVEEEDEEDESFEDYESFEEDQEYISEDGGDDVSAAAREALGAQVGTAAGVVDRGDPAAVGGDVVPLPQLDIQCSAPVQGLCAGMAGG